MQADQMLGHELVITRFSSTEPTTELPSFTGTPNRLPDSKPPLVAWLLVLFIGFGVFMYRIYSAKPRKPEKHITWDDAAYINENGKPELRQWRLDQVEM